MLGTRELTFLCEAEPQHASFQACRSDSLFLRVQLCFSGAYALCSCVHAVTLWYVLVYYATVSEAPKAVRFLAHLYDPIMTGKLDTGENIPAPGVEFGSATRLQNHAAPCSSDAATGFTEAMPLPAHQLQHTCTLSPPRKLTQYARPHTHTHTLGRYTANMST